MKKITSFSAEDTLRLAADIGRQAKPGDVLCLVGELGAGKTVFAQGLAQGLGYTGRVTSPTFALMHIYEGGRLPMYHFDLYRLAEDDIYSFGAEEYLDAGGVCLLEWPQAARELLPATATWVEIAADPAQGEDYRAVCITQASHYSTNASTP